MMSHLLSGCFSSSDKGAQILQQQKCKLLFVDINEKSSVCSVFLLKMLSLPKFLKNFFCLDLYLPNIKV